MSQQQDARLNDRIVSPSSHSFLHANISLREEKKKHRARERKEGWMDGWIN
jgi:hypothetical protein